MIKPLTKNEFVDIATNGIVINLYDNYVHDYIENLIKFINETPNSYYVSDFDDLWCEIGKDGFSTVKASFEKNNRIMFYLTNANMKFESDKKDAGTAIRIVYMHSQAWEAIHNDNKSNQSINPWPV